MAVNKVLPIGTKLIVDGLNNYFPLGRVVTVVNSASEVDGVTHCVSDGTGGCWLRDSALSELTEVAATAAETVDTPITFSDIVSGIAEDVFPVGRKFKTPAITDSMEMIYAEVFSGGINGEPYLGWEDGSSVQVNYSVASDPWFIELEFSSEFKQLEFQEEESDTSMVATVFDDGSATVEITEEGIGETMIGLTQQQVQQLQELLLYKADN